MGGMPGWVSIILLVGVIIGMIASGCIPLASIIIAASFWNSNCSISPLIPLPIWLLVNGGMMIFTELFIWALCLKSLLTSSPNPIRLKLILVLLTINVIFNIPWNIVGAITLFQTSTNCQTTTPQLWNITLADLIIQWISLIPKCILILFLISRFVY